jgi:hypothetical protein
MRSRIRPLLAAALLTASFSLSAPADVIFDDTANKRGGSTGTSSTQIGDQINAAGTARTVTELDIGYIGNSPAQTATLQAFLYANDGPGGAPGTLLWSSAVMTGVSISASGTLFAYTVPNIVVPNTFTWTSSIAGVGSIGYVPAGPPTRGSWVQSWDGSPGAFQALTDPGFEIESRVVTVPEPTSLVLAGLGLLGVLGCSVRQWRMHAARR